MSQEVLLDVRDMPPRERHPKIFKACEELPVGSALKLLNDHDPKPLFYEFSAERAGEFEWTPIERGPRTWSVQIKRVAAALGTAKHDEAPLEQPTWAAQVPKIIVDVREDLRAGREPFQKIMAAAMQARPGEVFIVRAIFEPRPLYAVLGSKGFEAWPERLADDDWNIYFHKKPQHYTLDVSDLEPPEPMVRILAKVQELGPKDVLEVTHHREPFPLYVHLEEAGFNHEIEKLGENRYRLKIWRKNG